jgi:hypothetical protein
MINSRTAALVLALVPATLVAQRGGGSRGGSRTGRSDEGGSSASSMLRLSNGDVEEMSPIKRLIDKRKELKLTDAQTKEFKDLESEMKQRNEHLFKVLDSLRKDMTPGREGGLERIANDREAVSDLVGNIRLSYNETLRRATERLDEPQKQTAAELVQKLNEDADKTLQDKLGGRGEDGRRGRPPVAS